VTSDPYAVLGLTRDASSAEVKRAYRRLAKSFHPDSAGESALPQFLAVHEAYEAIVAGRPMKPPRGAGTAPPTAGSWAAEPSRARAARSRRGRPATGAPAGGAGSRGGPAGNRTADGASARRRTTRKATLGSTSYDDAVQEPFEPEWQGASWYGRASGTYWTVNPKEYADPRKHGPEYQERARRASGRPADGVREDAAREDGAGPRADDARAEEARAGTGRAAEAAALAAERARSWADARRAPDRASPRAPATIAAEPGVEARIRRIAAARDLRSRIILALFGWPPLGVVAATLIGEATGCASFSVACRSGDELLPIAVGLAFFGLLLAIPALARLSAAGTVAIALTAVPVAAFVIKAEAPADAVPNSGAALAILGLAWFAGIVAVLVLSRGRILRA
jgi:hypothetical protein